MKNALSTFICSLLFICATRRNYLPACLFFLKGRGFFQGKAFSEVFEEGTHEVRTVILKDVPADFTPVIEEAGFQYVYE